MLGRLWFSLCALAALGCIGIAMALLFVAASNGRVNDAPFYMGVTVLIGGPLLCRGVYRWGLWVAGAKA